MRSCAPFRRPRDQTIVAVVQNFWATSRVKTFVPILAWRAVEQRLLDGSQPRPTTAVAAPEEVVQLPMDGGRERSDDRV
jgi:hypothetical protein